MTAARYQRYAIYWLPPEGGALADFGTRWLGQGKAGPGRRRKTAKAAANPAPELPAEMVERITADPRRYGLHATLKAPFRLKEKVAQAELVERLTRFAAGRRAFASSPLALTDLSGFLALTPAQPDPRLDALAHQCVVAFDSCREPLTASERARRLATGLTPHQHLLMEMWGYPYVLSEFRFHVTLTGRLKAAERKVVEPVLAVATAPLCVGPLAIDGIALVGDPGDGYPFEVVCRCPLASRD